MSEEVAIGIDLGTTYSCVGVYQHNKVTIIPNDKGNTITPSCVSFSARGQLVGDDAKYRLSLFPEHTVYDSKRLIGRDFNDPHLAKDLKYWPFQVVNDRGRPMIQIPHQPPLKPEQISSIVLNKLKQIAEDYLDRPVTAAVITVPAYFNESQRQATITAAKLADLKVLRIINEPTAAAMAFNTKLTSARGPESSGNKTILIYDLGGGTFDVSIIKIFEGIYQVIASKGDSHLGGSDFDNNLAEYLFQNYGNKRVSIYRLPETDQRLCKVRLRRVCEQAKCNLSRIDSAKVMLDSFYKEKDFETTVKKHEFEGLNSDMFRRTITLVEETLADARMRRTDLDEVVLVGGSTRIPKVRQLLEEFFRGTRSERLNCSIDPDEAVAYGATIQAAILTKNPEVEDTMLDDICLIDITPFTMGIAEVGDVMSPIVKKNTPIPCKFTAQYSTTEINQRYISVRVYQGEEPKATSNHLLGKFTVDNLPARPAGQVVFDVTFEVTADGTLEVHAKQVGGSAQNRIHIRNEKSYVSADEIERMRIEAKKYTRDDLDEQNKLIARHSLETCARWMKHVTDLHKKYKVKEIDQTISWLNSTDATAALYQQKHERLKIACYKIPTEYQTPGQLPASNRRRGAAYENPMPLYGNTQRNRRFGVGGDFQLENETEVRDLD